MFAIKECFNQPSLFFKHSPWVRNGDHLAKRGHRFKANQTCIFIVKMHTQIKHNLPHLTSHAHHPHEFIGSYCMQKNPPYNPQHPIPPRHPHPLDPPLHQPGVSKLDGRGQTRLECLGSGYQGQGGERKPARACLVVAGGPGRLHRLHQSRRGRLVDGEALLTLSIEIWFKIIVSV